MEMVQEWQFDGLVGPTHNYAGLAFGNVASHDNAGRVSNPRAAALQGLEKMRFVRNLGIPQAFLPPHYRPYLPELLRLGFYADNTEELINLVSRDFPQLLASVSSSSFMWTANAATITPSCDSADGKLHITPANMSSHYHRSIEAEFTYKTLRRIFHNQDFFAVHNFLYPHASLGDEGAANHMLVCQNNGLQGLHVFVVGDGVERQTMAQRFPARQRLVASQSISRLHKINMNNVCYLQQSPEAIDQGVFHNDVIAMNTTKRVIVHEGAFIPDDQTRLRELLSNKENIIFREVRHDELSIPEAVSTYLFNSQYLALAGGEKFALIAPGESESHPKSSRLIETLVNEGMIDDVHYLDLRESMRNGGGPACLRLRVVMTAQEAASIHPGIILTDTTFDALHQWVTTYYRDRLTFQDLGDPSFLRELNEAYLALEKIIAMPGLYQEIITASGCA